MDRNLKKSIKVTEKNMMHQYSIYASSKGNKILHYFSHPGTEPISCTYSSLDIPAKIFSPKRPIINTSFIHNNTICFNQYVKHTTFFRRSQSESEFFLKLNFHFITIPMVVFFSFDVIL